VPTVERDAEVERISAALEGAAGGEGQLVVVEGPAGIGKTCLIEIARTKAKEMGFGRLHAVGDEPDRGLPWGVVRQMAERSAARYSGDVRERILAGPAGAAIRALDEVAERGTDEVELARTLHKLWWVAADLSADRPLLITVDDAQWADLPSLRFLAYLSRRLSDLSLALVIGTRPVKEAGGPLAELSAARTGAHLVPRPLSVQGIGVLAGPEVAEPVAAALHAASGGNPFFAEQLAAELDRRGLAVADPASAAAVRTLAPQTVARSVLARHGPDEAALAGAAAVLGARTELALAAGLAGLEPSEANDAADALRRDHILSDDTAAVEFIHPVVREAVLAGVPAGERAELHALAARALRAMGASPDRVAGHLLHAPAGAFDGAAALLRAAGARALATGDAATAAALLRRAGKEEPPTDNQEAELGRALLRAGEPGQAREVLLAAAARAPTGRTRAERLAAAADATAAIEGPAAATAELRQTIDAWDGSREDRLVLDARLAVIAAFALGGEPGSGRHLAGFADLPGRSAEERMLLSMLAQRALYEPRPAAEVCQIATRALGRGALATDPAADLLAWGIAVHALSSADAFDEAEEEIAFARARVLPGGTPAEFSVIGMTSAYQAWLLGDLRRCEAEATGALEALPMLDPGPLREALLAVATRHAVHAQLELGKVEAAAAAVAAYDAVAAPGPELSVPVSRLRLARAALALARDDPGGALAQARRLESEERAAGAESVIIGWRTLAALALARLGREAEARPVVDEQLALARHFGAKSELGAALRLQARIDGERRLELLEEAVAALEEVPARLVLAGALADLGEALGVAGRRTQAREPLTRAVDLAEALGARPLAQRALDGLAALGDRPRRLAESGIDELTASERRVAQLAAGGRTNREIAQELFVTPKTVENHLRHAYAKLGVGGRRELAGALTPA
jgi:DNA-binding CsgD family transcriptional regulator